MYYTISTYEKFIIGKASPITPLSYLTRLQIQYVPIHKQIEKGLKYHYQLQKSTVFIAIN